MNGRLRGRAPPPRHLAMKGPALVDAAQVHQELVHVERLHQIGERALFQRRDALSDVLQVRQHDHVGGRGPLSDPPEQRRAIGPRQPDVADHDIVTSTE